MPIFLIGGGVRSGKSRFALEYAGKLATRRAFVATAQAKDTEMAERIKKHRQARDASWTTIEEPLDLAGVLRRRREEFDVFVVDCLTLWASNVLLDPGLDPGKEIESLGHCLKEFEGQTVILVTNEVGCGIVPENELARRYRDLVGELNQTVAEIADEVYWTVFGVAVAVKGARISSIGDS